MRHLKKGRKFGRRKKVRQALVKSLIHSMVLHGKMETTLARAKEIRVLIEKLLTKAKKGGLPSRRAIRAWLTPEGTDALFKIASRYENRRGGYTRITRTRPRSHDRAQMAMLEFVE